MNAEEILNGPDFFRCKRLHSTMRRSLCVEFQLGKPGKNPYIGSGLAGKKECCIKCSQGAAILREMNLAGFDEITIKKGDEIMSEKTEIICKGCGKTASGTHDEMLKFFAANPLCKSGFEGKCRECRKVEASARHAAKKAGEWKDKRKAVSLGFKPTPKDFNEVIERTQSATVMSPPNTLILNITAWPEIVEALTSAARDDVRTPELQAIAYIIEGLKEDKKLPVIKEAA
jgi:hypothetical protein